MKRWYFIVLALLTTCIYAQDIKFTANAPGVVEMGQQFRLTYSVNAQAERFMPPGLENFNILAGPSTSTSQNFSIINGKMTQNYEQRYTYILEATKEGEFNISSAEVTVEKKKYTSNTLKIEVIKGTGQSAQTSPNPAYTQQNQEEGAETSVSSSDLFLKVIVSKTKTFREEHLVATVKLYSKLNLTNLGEYRPPAFDGFIAEKLEVPPLSRLNQENVNGQIYLTGVIDKYILYPQTVGEIEIKPFELICYYQAASRRRPGNMFDEFFGNYERGQSKAYSAPVKIKVQSLPENKPASFEGAVGNLKMDASIDKTNTKTNEAITLRIKISGNGNLKYINAPKIEFPSDFDAYDPKISDNIKYSDNGASGAKSFEYLLIPRHAGEFTIPGFEFSYFDTGTNTYKNSKAGPYKINVLKGAEDTTMALTNVFTKEDIKFLGKDIRFIKKGKSNLKQKDIFIFGSTKYYFYFIAFIVLFVLTFLMRRKRILENANTQLVRTKKADKYARRRLQKASDYLKQNKSEVFYEELVKALWGYVSDKFSIPVAGLSKESARHQMTIKGIEPTYIDQVLGIIDRCEYARYAPASESTQMDTLYNDSIEIISKLQQQFKG